MADTKTEKTVAEELREAAARAREHLLPHVIAVVIPQTAIVTICVDHKEPWETVCRNCISFDARHRELANLLAALFNAREPLASWLEETAEKFDDEVRGRLHDTCDGAIGEDCYCFREPLAVARVLNGTALPVGDGSDGNAAPCVSGASVAGVEPPPVSV
ncbi:hypothetical protein [Nonomuraea sp. NPDC001023]|uniref:hypothetical protein n=1 Tax=unclassified Nonomuraea TaxID=2593643 RepID=UPI00332E76F3